MLKQTIVTGIVGVAMIMTTPAMARPHNNHNFERIHPVRHCVSGQQINNRQARQNRRINQGVRSGELVNWEERELRQEQRQIRKAERRMRSDGCMSRPEFNRLMSRLDRASDRIYQLKNNHLRRGHFNHRRHR
ncbi:MAG: hypothetical protein R3F02_07665 [Thiolinea sp.]